MQYIEKYLDQIKRNLSIILLLPTILGGLWQLFELSKMSISFVRFFSATQLLPDGLLVLLITTLLYITFKFTRIYKIRLQKKIIKVNIEKPKNKMNNFFIKQNLNNKLAYVDNPIYRKNIGFIFFNILIILIPTFFLIYVIKYTNFFNDLLTNFNFFSFLLIWIPSIMVIKEMMTSSLILLVHIIESDTFKQIQSYCTKKPITKEIILFPFRILITQIIAISFFAFYFLISFFHQEYFLPKNLKNLEYIKESLHNPDYNKSKISYFNDKYIFIEHKNNEKDAIIEIIKFDELLKNQEEEKRIKLFFEKLNIK
jgi:hypothetical protein